MIELHSLLGLVHAILSGQEVADGIAQLNDIFEENEIPRLQTSHLYYTGNYDDDYSFVTVGKSNFLSPLQRQEFMDGLSVGKFSSWWNTLEEVDADYLAANANNHDLLEHLSEEEKRKLLGEEYEDYLEAKQEAENWQ